LLLEPKKAIPIVAKRTKKHIITSLNTELLLISKSWYSFERFFNLLRPMERYTTEKIKEALVSGKNKSYQK
jgi:hypothetical protein